MKLSKVMLAVATLAVGTSAFSAPTGSEIAITAGASATRGNLITALTNLCTAAGGVTSSLGSGNFRSIVCADTAVTEGALGTYVSKASNLFKKFSGTDFVEVRVNTEGSFSAVQLLNGIDLQVRNPATAAASNVYPAGSVKVGGLLDVEPTAFTATTIGTNTLFTAPAAGFAQTFGVAVTKDLYNAMFADQKTSGFIPASCNLADTGIPACVPSIGKAQMATIMADNSFNAAYSKGANFLAPSLTEGTELRYVRRVDTSGTQAAAQNYFLGLPCSVNGLSVVAEPTTDDEAGGLKDALITSIRVLAAPGTGDVLGDLNKVDGVPDVVGVPSTIGNQPIYGIGVVSGENNGSGVNWKWLRVGGAPLGENATPGTAGQTNSASMKNGSYDFYYESVYMGGSATGDAFWATVTGALNTLTLPVGLVNATDLSAGYNKNGKSCLGSSSN